MDVRKKILQSTQLLSHDLKYDFRNFPLIDTEDIRNARYPISSNFKTNNRFAIFNSSSIAGISTQE